MFRIEKQLVQAAPPAQIPLIPVMLPQYLLSELEAAADTADKVAAANAVATNAAAAERADAQSRADAQTQARRDQLLREARQKAEQMKRDTENEAQALLQEAREQARATHAQAWGEGYEEGRQQALAEASAQQQAAQAEIRALLKEINTARDEFYRGFESETVDLALAIASKIAHIVVRREDFAVESMISHALKQMRREGKITIRMSEEMYAAFFKSDSATFVLGDESVKVNVTGDTLLNEGDIMLESDGETINAGVDSQLKFITLAFGRPWEPAP